MLLSHLLVAAALVSGPTPPPAAGLSMRVPAEGLELSSPRDAATLAGRIAEQSRAFCDAHVQTVTPGHVGDRRMCERAMAEEAINALEPAQWRAFVRAGGATALRRAQR